MDAMFGVLGGQRSAKPAAAQRRAAQGSVRVVVVALRVSAVGCVAPLARCGVAANTSTPLNLNVMLPATVLRC